MTVPTSGNVPNSSTATFNSAGTYYWQAVYSGDTNNNGASSPCTATNNEQLTVNKASPTITTTLSSGSITAGSTAYDTSTLTGASATHGGRRRSPTATTPTTPARRASVTVNTVTVPTSGNVPNSSTVTFNSVGTYYWQAVYSGDANNNGASSRARRRQQRATDGGQGHADTDGERPGDWHDRDRHHGGQHQLDPRRLLGLDASGTITFKVFAQATAPTTCTTGGTTVGTATVNNGNATYTRRPATRRRVRATTGGTRPMAATPTTTQRPRPVAATMSETTVAKFAPTVTAALRGRARRDGHRGGLHQLRSGGRHDVPGRDRHHHLHCLRPGHRPDHLHHRGHHGGHGHGQQRQRHLQPDGRLHPDDRRQPMVVRVLWQ